MSASLLASFSSLTNILSHLSIEATIRMTDRESINETLTCAICLDVACFDNAVETSCCHQLFCSPCIATLRVCPACRANNFQSQPAHFARRLIGSLVAPCPNEGCTAQIPRSNLPDHLAISCTFQPITCPDPKCKNFKCSKKSFLEHVTSKHGQFLLENVHKLWEKQETSERGVRYAPKEKQSGREKSFPSGETTISSFSCSQYRGLR